MGKTHEPYLKGDIVVMEGKKSGMQDVGMICKVFSGAKTERFVAAATTKDMQDGHSMRRVLWRCSEIEHARYESQVVSLEKSVLPLFAERLPDGANALGVGASLDGTYLRLFVNFDNGISTAVTAAAAAAAAVLGSLLGCETELLAGSQLPTTAIEK